MPLTRLDSLLASLRSGRPDLFQSIFPKVMPLVLGLIAMAILYLRDTASLTNPVVYTEDGQWIGFALRNGWLEALINAKPGYYVWGNIVSLWSATGLSQLACDDTLACLPYTISLISVAFIASVAVTVFYAVKQWTGWLTASFAFLALLLVPFGISANEVIGRISNIGFFVPVFVVALLLLRPAAHRLARYFIDAVIFLSIGTNPTVVPFIFAAFALSCFQGPGTFTARVRRELPGIVLAGTATLLVALRIMSAASTTTGTLEPAHVIEVAFARSLLFPFLFTNYENMTDAWSMALAAVWLAFVIAALVLSLRRPALLPFAAFLLALCVQLPLIILARPSLTQQLGEYTTTFPDRYFIPANSLVIVASVLAISILVQYASRAPRIAGLLTGGSLVAFYAMNMDPLFEGRQPRYQIMLGLSFEDQICVAADPSDSLNSETLAIPIYFAGWTMEVPSHVVSDNIAHKSCLNRFQRFPPDDENWDRGISRTAPIFVVPNLRSFREGYAVGRTVTLRDGESRRIVEQAQFNPEYLWVTLSGDPFSREKAGPIHKFKVSN